MTEPCTCACKCATLANWQGDQRRFCGCCPASCDTCSHPHA